MASYTVQKGDSLSKIGARYGVSWNSLAIANNIKSPYTVYPGQVLSIPGATGGSYNPTPVNAGGSPTGNGADFSPVLDKLIGGILLYGIFRVLMKVF